MATITPIQLKPESAQFLTTNFPQYVKANGTNFPVSGLQFDPTNDQTCFWKFKPPSYGSGSLLYTIEWYAATATAGNIVYEAQLAALTPNVDTQDIETKAFGTLNFIQDTHLGTTAKRAHDCVLTQSNLDSLAAGDLVFLRFARDANGTNATDDMAGFSIVTLITVSYSDT